VELSERLDEEREDETVAPPTESAIDETTIASDLDYLRVMEEERANKGQNTSHRHFKHASMPASSISSSRNAFSGSKEDAYRRFESERSAERPPHHDDILPERNDDDIMPPTEPPAIDTKSNVDEPIDETVDLSPEVRRELERQHQLQEERRVAEAAAAYRNRAGGEAPAQPRKSSRASAIQDRVKNLLDESNKAPPVKKTASGYGRYTEVAEGNGELSQPEPTRKQAPPVSQKKLVPTQPHVDTFVPPPASADAPKQRISAVPARAPMSRPSAPPKPASLRKPSGLPLAAPLLTNNDTLMAGSDDLESDFSKRYPSLSLEMVEREMEISRVSRKPPRPVPLRVKDV